MGNEPERQIIKGIVKAVMVQNDQFKVEMDSGEIWFCHKQTPIAGLPTDKLVIFNVGDSVQVMPHRHHERAGTIVGRCR